MVDLGVDLGLVTLDADGYPVVLDADGGLVALPGPASDALPETTDGVAEPGASVLLPAAGPTLLVSLAAGDDIGRIGAPSVDPTHPAARNTTRAASASSKRPALRDASRVAAASSDSKRHRAAGKTVHAASSAPAISASANRAADALGVRGWLDSGHGVRPGHQQHHHNTFQLVSGGDVGAAANRSRQPRRADLASARRDHQPQPESDTTSSGTRPPRQVDDTNTHGFTLDRERHHLF